MKTNQLMLSVIGLAGMAALATIVVAQPGSPASHPGPEHLSGTWLNQVTIDNPPPGVTDISYKTLTTFTVDGGLTETSWAPGAETVGNGHGRWDRKGQGEFALTAIAIWPGAVLKGRSTITFGNSVDEYTGIFRVDVLDADGNSVATGSGVLHGRRLQSEPLD